MRNQGQYLARQLMSECIRTINQAQNGETVDKMAQLVSGHLALLTIR